MVWKTKTKIAELLVVLILAFAFMGGITILSGSLFSGYHLVDDHWVLRITSYFKDLSFSRVMKKIVLDDLRIRFRPLYSVLLVVKAKCFGYNLNVWMICAVVEGMATFLCLYYFARYNSLRYTSSLLFSLFVLAGNQFSVWCRALNQENEGMLFFAITMLIMAAGKSKKNKGITKAIVVVFVLMCSLMKESFVLCIPTFILFKHYYIKDDSGNVIDGFDIILAILFAVEIIIIFLKVGVGQIGYAGFTQDTPIRVYWRGIKDIFIETLLGQFIILYIGCICFVACKKEKWSDWFEKKKLCLLAVFYSILVQVLLHAKSTMVARYKLPLLFYIAFFCFIILLPEITKKDLLIIFLASIIVFVSRQIKVSINSAREWAEEGNEAKRLFASIDRVIQSENSENVIVFFDEPNEYVVSIKTYIDFMYSNKIKCYKRDEHVASDNDVIVTVTESKDDEGVIWKTYGNDFYVH